MQPNRKQGSVVILYNPLQGEQAGQRVHSSPVGTSLDDDSCRGLLAVA
jgi:hypothetical protein